MSVVNNIRFKLGYTIKTSVCTDNATNVLIRRTTNLDTRGSSFYLIIELSSCVMTELHGDTLYVEI